jgi:chromosome segregation ATPase
MAEEKLKLKTEFDKLLAQHSESHDKRKKDLEDEFTRRKEEGGRRVAALEAEKSKLWATAEDQKRTIEGQVAELGKIEEQCDVLERAKDSVKQEKKDLKVEIETTRKEFALDPKPISHLYIFWPHRSQ